MHVDFLKHVLLTCRIKECFVSRGTLLEKTQRFVD